MLPISTLVSTDRPVAVQGTLDDIAEEMLNGLFCHYEPPTKKKKQRGILRTPKMFRRSDSNLTTVSEATSASKKGVRWSHRVEASYPKPPSTEVHCNVIESVVDGCAEVGLVKSPTKAKEALAKYDLTELEKKHAMNAAKKAEESDYKKKKAAMRRAMEEDSSDSDDSGVIQSDNVRPPPPPPPPPRNCGLIADICGAVHMECGSTKDTFTPKLIESEDRKVIHRVEHHRRPKQPFDYMEGEVEPTGDGLIHSVPSSDSGTSAKSGSRFSSFKRIWPRKRGDKNGLNRLDGYESDPETRGRGRRHSPYGATRGDVDPVIRTKRSKSPSRITGEDEDWDQSMPIFSGNKHEKSKRTSWLPKVSQSINGRRSSSPGPLRSVDRRNSLSGSQSGSKRLHSPSSGFIDRSQSFDRNLQVTQTFAGSSFPNNASTMDDSFERQSMITAYREAFDPASSEASLSAMDDSGDRQSFITAYRHGLGDGLTNDDLFDRQSFVTASRKGVPYLNAPRDQKEWGDSRRRISSKEKASPRDRFSLRRSRSPSRRSRSQSPVRRASSPFGSQKRSSRGMGNQQPLSDLPFYTNQNVNGNPGAYGYQAFPPLMRGVSPEMLHPGIPHHPGVAHLQQGEGQLQQAPATSKVEEVSWEERTRQAWERLRGSTTSIAEQLASSLMMTEPDQDKQPNSEKGARAPDSKLEYWSQDQHLAPQPIGILKKNSQEKRVTFGPPQEQQYFTDFQDENMSVYEAPSHEGRKRYKFRGTKILTGIFSKKKKNHSGGKKDMRGLNQSRSTDMTASMSASMSRSWGEDGSIPHHQPLHFSQPNLGYHTEYYHQQQPGTYPPQSYMIQHPLSGNMGYYYPAVQGNMPVHYQSHPPPYTPQHSKQPAPFHHSPVRATIQ